MAEMSGNELKTSMHEAPRSKPCAVQPCKTCFNASSAAFKRSGNSRPSCTGPMELCMREWCRRWRHSPPGELQCGSAEQIECLAFVLQHFKEQDMRWSGGRAQARWPVYLACAFP